MLIFLYSPIFLLFKDVTAQNTTDQSTTIRTRSFEIKCCKGGNPQPSAALTGHVTNWTSEEIIFPGFNESCKLYRGHYHVPLSILMSRDGDSGVRCLCPEPHLDRNCLHTPECKNGGYRAYSIGLRCSCPGDYFGEVCEHYCWQGERRKNRMVRDYCSCKPHFYGVDCSNIECLNGGTAVDAHGCLCPVPYLGKHCEARLKGHDSSSYRGHSMLQRDLSGTVVSFLMVLILMLIIYCMVKRRLAAQRRNLFLSEIMNRTRGQTAETAVGADNGPPPYTIAVGGPNMEMNAVDFPPLPSYDEAIKIETQAPPPPCQGEANPVDSIETANPVDSVETDAHSSDQVQNQEPEVSDSRRNSI